MINEKYIKRTLQSIVLEITTQLVLLSIEKFSIEQNRIHFKVYQLFVPTYKTKMYYSIGVVSS